MTALTVTVSDKIDFEDSAQIKSVLETVGSTNTNDRFIVIPGANSKCRIVKMSIA